MKTLIFLLLQTCQHRPFFRNHPSHIWCANPSRTFFFGRFYQALMTSRPPFFTAWFAPPPPPTQRSDQSRQYLHSKRTCYCAVIISSPPTISLKCCEKALKDDRHIASVAKPLLSARGSPQVRGLQASACLFQRFHASDRTQSRCGAPTFSWE